MIIRVLLLIALLTLSSSSKAEVFKELSCLATNIYFEARDQTEKGQLVPFFVTLNRVKSSRFPSTICRVVWQPYQFSWTHDGLSDIPDDIPVYKEIGMRTQYWLENYQYLEDITEGALFYYAPKHVKKKPCWVDEKYYLKTIGDHRIYSNESRNGSCIG